MWFSSDYDLSLNFSQLVVLLFKLVQNGRQSRLSFQQRIQLSAAIWDIAFDASSNLMVFQAFESVPVIAYSIFEDGDRLKVGLIPKMDSKYFVFTTYEPS